jgi:nucleoside-diphosphate-sugar epimerase
MKALVTGATGFVGSCLTRRLLADGHEVHVLTRETSSLWRLADLAGGYANHLVDLRDTAELQGVVARIAPEWVFHLATYGGLSFQKESDEIVNSNFIGTVNLLHACARAGFSCFVNTGSSSEYGLKTEAMKETDLLEPIGNYGVSKAAATLYCRSFAIERDLPVTTLRLFSPYGPWDSPSRFIPYLIASLLCGRRAQVSDPASVRDFIFVDDVISVYLKVAARPLKGEIVNVGSGLQCSIGRVAGMVEEILGVHDGICWGAIGSKQPEPALWVADIEKAKRIFDWSPQVDLREGLTRTISWLRSHPDLYR